MLEMETGNGSVTPTLSIHGWIIWMQRLQYADDFNKAWADYRDGWGVVSENSSFWIGLEKVHYLTTQGPGGIGSWMLRVEMLTEQTGRW